MDLVSRRKVAQQVFYTCCSQDVKRILMIAGIFNAEENLGGDAPQRTHRVRDVKKVSPIHSG